MADAPDPKPKSKRKAAAKPKISEEQEAQYRYWAVEQLQARLQQSYTRRASLEKRVLVTLAAVIAVLVYMIEHAGMPGWVWGLHLVSVIGATLGAGFYVLLTKRSTVTKTTAYYHDDLVPFPPFRRLGSLAKHLIDRIAEADDLVDRTGKATKWVQVGGAVGILLLVLYGGPACGKREGQGQGPAGPTRTADQLQAPGEGNGVGLQPPDPRGVPGTGPARPAPSGPGR